MAKKTTKKKYFINVHYDIVVPVEIEADNEDDALDMAKLYDPDFNKIDYCDVSDACVTDVEDI